MANIIMAYMVRHWKSLSESQEERMLIAVAHRNRRTPCKTWSKRLSFWPRPFYFIPFVDPDMFHDACRCITAVRCTVKVTLRASSWLGCDFPEGYPMTITVFRHKICHRIWLITKRSKLAWMSEATSVDSKKSDSRRLSHSRSQHEGRFTQISRQRATSAGLDMQKCQNARRRQTPKSLQRSPADLVILIPFVYWD